MKRINFYFAVLITIGTQSLALASEEHGHDHEHEHEEEQVSIIDDKLADDVGIVTAIAGPQLLKQRVTVYGEFTTAPEQLSHVRARYSGLIKSVAFSIGDDVKQGLELARVESNESLKIYSIQAPIDGTVIQRHANQGEVTRNQILFSIANFDTLWAELKIFSTQQSRVAEGQAIQVHANGQSINATIEHIIPVLDKPYQIARAKIANHQLKLSPGTFIEAHVVVDTFKANLVVEKRGLQLIGEDQGVFVKEGHEYRFTPLVLGRSDDQFVEVLSGLVPGQHYVTVNSYLVKADIEKSEAEHDH